jgi:hypothetical protein
MGDAVSSIRCFLSLYSVLRYLIYLVNLGFGIRTCCTNIPASENKAFQEHTEHPAEDMQNFAALKLPDRPFMVQQCATETNFLRASLQEASVCETRAVVKTALSSSRRLLQRKYQDSKGLCLRKKFVSYQRR